MNTWNISKYDIVVNINTSININTFGFIYNIKNIINNKQYFGQTVNYKRRLLEHCQSKKINYLYNAFNKYGLNNFEFSIIDSAITIEELNKKEIYYINKYKTNNRYFGYNIESGGKNAIPSIETLGKMSKSHIGIKQTENWKNKRIAKAYTNEAKKYGKRKTDNEKKELSIKSPRYWLGKTRDINTKTKISDTKRKNGLSDKQKELLCKKVYKINSITNEIILTYNSTLVASINENVNQSTISRWCKNNKNKNNIIWKY